MRWTLALVTLATLGWTGRAAATSCATPPWDDDYDNPLRGFVDVPVDAQPWSLEICPYSGGVPDPRPCRLVHELEAIDVVVEYDASDACALDYRSTQYFDGPRYLQRFVPESPLTPGTQYTLECGEDGDATGTVTTRADDRPAAAPPALEIDRAYYARDNNGCCGWGDDIEVRFTDMDAAYLREGGYIEAQYPTGELFVLVTPDDGQFLLPATREVITFTAVSASGERGEPLELDAGEIDGDLVYVACGIDTRHTPAALWLLAPFLWILRHRRARRSA